MGKLFVIPTPVGNLGDITYRAVKTFDFVDYILAEDTRVTARLLSHLEISKKVHSFHNHNEHKVVERYAESIKNGDMVAMVSDAGTPGISDPGFLLIRKLIEEGIEVECFPGATAFVPALVSSGLPSDRFVFEGFLPHKKGRQTKLKELAEEERTLILYESPHRLVKLLEELKEYFGAERQLCVSREISKLFEEHKRGTVQEVLEHFTETNPRGEIVVCITGKVVEKVKEGNKYKHLIGK